MADQPDAVQAERPPFPDEMAEASFNTLVSLIEARNSEVGKINAVKGDRVALTEQVEAQSTKAEIVEARNARDEAQAVLDEAVMALHAVVTPEVDALLADAEGSVKEAEEAVKEQDAKIKPGVQFFKKMFGEDLAGHLPALARLKGFSTKGAGSSGRRVRGYTVDVTVDGETRGFDNLASAAKYLVVDTSVLQEAFFAAAGNPEKLKDAPNRVDFDVTFTETYADETTGENTAHLVATREEKDEAPAEAEDDSEAEGTDEDE